MNITFEQIQEALQNHTPCSLNQHYCQEEDNLMFTLLDGCGEAMGDDFWDLEDVIDYITQNEEVANELFATT